MLHRFAPGQGAQSGLDVVGVSWFREFLTAATRPVPSAKTMSRLPLYV